MCVCRCVYVFLCVVCAHVCGVCACMVHVRVCGVCVWCVRVARVRVLVCVWHVCVMRVWCVCACMWCVRARVCVACACGACACTLHVCGHACGCVAGVWLCIPHSGPRKTRKPGGAGGGLGKCHAAPRTVVRWKEATWCPG